jgi:hypothetical protein
MQDAAEKQENGEETLRMHEVDPPNGNKIGDNVSKRYEPVAREEGSVGSESRRVACLISRYRKAS